MHCPPPAKILATPVEICATEERPREVGEFDGDWRVAAVGHRTCDLWVACLSPASAPLRSGLEHATYTYVSLSPSSITWYQSKGGDTLRLGR